MTAENRLWGQKRIQAELTRLGFTVSARTVAKYMNSRHGRGPSSGWRNFLKRHESSIWACDFFCVQTILFQTLYVFFVIRRVNREILHVATTPFPTAEWVAQKIVECCAWDRLPPQFLIHDRDSRYGATFDRRLRGLGIKQVRTPFQGAPGKRDFGEVGEDHLLVFNEAHLRRAISRYAAYFNYWRPHRSLGQRSPCESTVHQFRPRGANCKITAEPVWVDCITSIGVLHDGLYFCALHRIFAPYSRS
jgi:transposase InsO family protein